MRLGEYLKRLRVERGLSLRAAATRLGVNHTAIDQWEKGLHRPSSINLIRMGSFYGVDITGLPDDRSPIRFDVVEEPDELALLALWRQLTLERQRFLLEFLGGRPAMRTEDDT